MSRSSSFRLSLTPAAASAVLRGHPWVYAEGLGAKPAGDAARAGAVVELTGRDGAFVGRGLFDPESPIAVRVITLRRDEPIDASMLTARLTRALARRSSWFDDPNDTNAYRLCNGEGDRLPGLVVDRYADFAVVRTDGAAIEPWTPEIIAGARSSLEKMGIVGAALRLASHRRAARPAGGGRAVAAPATERLEPLFGPAPPESLEVRENGWAMLVDLARGQKTGAFLDQRENRRRVFTMAARKRVLNLFSYAGGFSLAAALGGAARVTSVDIAHAAHATAQQSFRLNGLDPSQHEFVTADVFAFLEGAFEARRQWDLVISDPPSFAPNERSVPKALAAYRRLHRACARVLADGGTLCAASCSSHVHTEAFLATLDDASLGRSDLSVTAVVGPPRDHPIIAGWTEGLYLKWIVLG